MTALRAHHLTRLRWAMEPAIDATGGRVAFVSSGPDADHDRLGYRVRVVDVATGTSTLVQSVLMTRNPAWSPSGALAVLAHVDGRWQPALVDGTLSVPVALTGDVRGLDWAPGGNLIACDVVTPGRQRQAWVVDLGHGDAWPLLPERFGTGSRPVWAPDGSSVAVIGDGGVWTVDVEAPGAPRLVAGARGAVRAVAWSPDGASLAYLGQHDDVSPWANGELWVVGRDGRDPRRLGAGLDRSIGQVVRGDDERGVGPPSLAWSPDGTAVLAANADGGASAIVAFDPGGGCETVVDGDRAILEFAVAPVSGAIAYTWSDPYTPGELSVQLPDGTDRQCTNLARPIRDGFALAPTERITHRADDGTVVEGWLTSPPAPGPWPLVVQVHGGPHYPVGLRFSFDAQRMAGHGFAFLRANPHGSQGYGAGFADISGDWGGRDLADLVGLLDGAIARHPIDARRVAIIGESYGGYMAMWAIGRTERFAAAVAENGVSDLATAVPVNPDFWGAELGTTPHRARDRSPITYADRIAAPLLLIHGENDSANPVTQSEAMLAALQRRGHPVELIVVPGGDHFVNVFGTTARRIEKTERLDEFLLSHLRAQANTPEQADTRP